MKFLSLLTICLAIASCGSDKTKQNVAKSLQSDTLLFSQEGSNVTIHYTDSGNLKASIFAPVLIGYKKDGNDIIKMPKGVKGDFYNSLGIKESTLTAEKGISYQTKKITEVWQNVIVTNAKGEKLNTEKLIWNQNTQKIHTDKFVRITTKNEILTGEGMEAEQDFTKWVILKPRGSIAIKSDSTSN
jgi:LPS export ABC transporter protein LptC